MILYHGSNLKIDVIDLTKCKLDQYSFHSEKALKYLREV